jgi:hypothetical protein
MSSSGIQFTFSNGYTTHYQKDMSVLIDRGVREIPKIEQVRKLTNEARNKKNDPCYKLLFDEIVKEINLSASRGENEACVKVPRDCVDNEILCQMINDFKKEGYHTSSMGSGSYNQWSYDTYGCTWFFKW